MSDGSGKTASGMLNSAGKQNGIPTEAEAPRRQECELGDAWSPPQSLIPVSLTSHHGVPEKCAPRPAQLFFFQCDFYGKTREALSLTVFEARDVLSHKPPARGLERYEVPGS